MRYRGYWKSKEIQREFLNSLAKKFNISVPQDWGKITNQEFRVAGGAPILKHYNFSVSKTLREVYPGSIIYMNNTGQIFYGIKIGF